jgi:L-amino acid N-acyltransferase YncA
MIRIRRAEESDHDPVWDIFSEVIKTGDTYVFDPCTSRSDLEKHWFADCMTTFVAEEDGRIVGTYIIKQNQIDLGNHIANCSYMVSPAHQGKGIGKKMCAHSLRFARKLGYRGMQFNIVVSTNKVAIELWKKFGFEIIGTTPGGFRHPELGYVDTCIMFRSLK